MSHRWCALAESADKGLGKDGARGAGTEALALFSFASLGHAAPAVPRYLYGIDLPQPFDQIEVVY